MQKHKLPDPSYLREILSYDMDTGHLTYKEREAHHMLTHAEDRRASAAASFNTVFAGKRAAKGYDRVGYHKCKILGVHYAAHRVCWAIHYGEWPDGHIDHINGVRTDNSISNLRVVTPQQNARNRAMSSLNTSGVTGVVRSGRKWIAKIGVDGKSIHLGTFETKGAAASARKAAERMYGFCEDHGREPVEIINRRYNE